MRRPRVSNNSKPITQSRRVILQRIMYLSKSIRVAFAVNKTGGRKRLNYLTAKRSSLSLFLAHGFTFPSDLCVMECNVMLAISLLCLLKLSYYIIIATSLIYTSNTISRFCGVRCFVTAVTETQQLQLHGCTITRVNNKIKKQKNNMLGNKTKINK
jgi:hypothetical protein